HGVLQLADGFGLDLPYALASDLEDAADLFQRVGVAILQAVAEADDFPLAPGERLQQILDLLPQNHVISTVDRIVTGLIFQELAKTRVLAVADRPVEADGMPADVQDAADLFQRQAGLLRDFFGRSFTAKFLQEPLLDIPQLAEHVDHVDRNADRAG